MSKADDSHFSVANLVTALNHKDRSVQQNAVKSLLIYRHWQNLKKITEISAITYLVTLLSNINKDVRIHAALLLESLINNDPSNLPLIAQASDIEYWITLISSHFDTPITIVAVLALESLTFNPKLKNQTTMIDWKNPIRYFAELLGHENTTVEAIAVMALKNLVLSDSNNRAKITFNLDIPLCIKILNSSDGIAEAKKIALKALSKHIGTSDLKAIFDTLSLEHVKAIVCLLDRKNLTQLLQKTPLGSLNVYRDILISRYTAIRESETADVFHPSIFLKCFQATKQKKIADADRILNRENVSTNGLLELIRRAL
jgi:hypothetical protein